MPERFTIADVNELRLEIYTNKKGVFFHRPQGKSYKSTLQFVYEFDDNGLVALADYLEDQGHYVWGSKFVPKPYDGEVYSDYHESFDSATNDWSLLELDQHLIFVTPPLASEKLMYRFTRKKLETFVYELRNPTDYKQGNLYD